MPYKSLERARQQKREWKAKMTPEQKEHERALSRQRWANRTPEQRRHKSASRTREQRRDYNLKSKYGITQQGWDEKFISQGSCCANELCKATDANNKKGWHVDHCHSTGKVRGILCSNCNVALGHAQDNENRLIGLSMYVLKHREIS